MKRSLGGWKCDKNTSFLGGFLDRVLDSGSGRVNLRCYSAQNEIARGCSPLILWKLMQVLSRAQGKMDGGVP